MTFKNPMVDLEGKREEPVICENCGADVQPNNVKAHKLTPACIRKMFERVLPGYDVDVTVTRLPYDRARVKVSANLSVEVKTERKERRCRRQKRCTS
ncbi:MAG TPA: hypothetical protein VN622_11080 [Clostridia bacterium]|nr:hypothetical protein [Clostridia bacterium]